MKQLLIVFLFAYIELHAFSIDKLPQYSTVYDKNLNPHITLELVLKKASKSHKPVLLMVGGEWCKWCGQFDNFLDDHPQISEDFYSTFEVLRIYYGKDISDEGKSLLKQFPPLKGTPHLYILNSHAKLLKSIDTSHLERGYSYNKRKIKDFIEENKIQNTKKDTK